MPDTSTVGFHPDLEVSFLTPLRDWPDAEVRAIDVGCHNRNTSTRLPFLWDGESQERALVPIDRMFNVLTARGRREGHELTW